MTTLITLHRPELLALALDRIEARLDRSEARLGGLTYATVRQLAVVGLAELDIWGHVRGLNPAEELKGWCDVVGTHRGDGVLVRACYNPAIDQRTEDESRDGVGFRPAYRAALDAANAAPLITLNGATS